MTNSHLLRSRLLLLAAAFLATIASRSTLAHEPEKVPDSVLHRPTPAPDRIILTFAGDPKTTMAVTWRTDATVPHALAQIAVATEGPDFRDHVQQVEATTEPLTHAAGTAHYHSVVFEGLKPGTLYAYRVGDGANWSEFFQFRTAPAKNQPFSFIYFGDAQNDLKSLWSRVIRQAATDASKAAFLLHAGDLVNRHVNDHEWGEWFGAGGWLNGMIPSIPTPGNHEYNRNEDGQPQLSPHWQKQFTLPRNGPETLAESAYYVDYQNMRIISLNSNEQLPEQAAWLEKVLSDPNRPLWTVLTFHHPVHSVARGRDNPDLRSTWQPLFDRYKVDLVLQGHDHTYARSGPRLYDNLPSGEQVRRDVAGTVYVVSVSGPKMYELLPEPWMLRAAENTQLYQIIKVNGDRLDFQARTATGALYDAFVLRKRAPGEAAEFLDLQPATQENRRLPVPVPAAAAGAEAR